MALVAMVVATLQLQSLVATSVTAVTELVGFVIVPVVCTLVASLPTASSYPYFNPWGIADQEIVTM